MAPFIVTTRVDSLVFLFSVCFVAQHSCWTSASVYTIYCPIWTDSFYFPSYLAFPRLGSGRITIHQRCHSRHTPPKIPLEVL